METLVIGCLVAAFGFMMTVDQRVARHPSLYFLGMAIWLGAGLFLMITSPSGVGVWPQIKDGEEAPFTHLRTYRFLGACILFAAVVMLCHGFLQSYGFIQ